MENEIMYLKLDDIIPNRFQPREIFDEKALQELADSIKQHGVIEPIIVRPIFNKFEIVAGERRYKASALAGLTKIPAIVKVMDDKESSIVAYIENAHRKDVSAIEEAKTTERILKNNNMTQEELAKELGISQSTLANKLRLLTLPIEVQESLMRNEISERHARSLLSIKDEKKQIELLNKIKEKRMTVRELDSEIKMINGNNNMNNNYGLNNNNDYVSFINSYTKDNINTGNMANNMNQNIVTPIPSSMEINNSNNNEDFMKFLNEYDSSYQRKPEETPAPTTQNNEDFMKFLNEYDNNYQRKSEETPAPVTQNNEDFMKFLNEYDSNYQRKTEETPVPATQNNEDFMKFLNEYDSNYQRKTEETSKPTTQNNEIPNMNDNSELSFESYLNNTVNKNIMINNVTPPITNSFNTNSYVEDNPNFIDVSKANIIDNVDTIINELKATIEKIKNQSKFKVDTDEINFDDIYQITIKIDKREAL